MADDVPPSDTDSVLQSVKKVLGIAAEYDVFDLDITLHINSVLSTLQQLGVGLTDDQAMIVDANDTWDSIFTTQKNIAMIKSYVVLRVRLQFDPPATGFTTESYKEQIKEYEWRLAVATSSAPND